MERFFSKQPMEVMPPQQEAAPMIKGFFGGLLLGSAIGAGAMLLMAPCSGHRTRARLQHRYDELRDQLAESMEETEEEMAAKARHLAADARSKARELKHQRKVTVNGR